MPSPSVTIVLLTRNGMADGLPRALDAMLGQETSFPFEVLALDSESTDGTRDFLRSRPSVRMRTVPLASFGHGRTRQGALSLTSAPVLAYVTQDAVPADASWLEALVERLGSADDVAAACSRVLPHPEAHPLRRYGVLAEWMAGAEDFEVRAGSPGPAGPGEPAFRCLHNISAAYRRAALEEVGFRDVPFGEDLLLARDLLRRGRAVAFASRSVVLHAHACAWGPVFRRNVVDGRFHRRALGRATVGSRRALVRSLASQVRRDWGALRRDGTLGRAAKLRCALYSPWIHLAESLGQYAGNAGLL